MSLTYCPEGGEHEWILWHDHEESQMVVDCDRCTQTAIKVPQGSEDILVGPLPVNLERLQDSLSITPRREV